MRDFNLFEKIADFLNHKIAVLLPESVKRKVLDDLIVRALLKIPEENRSFLDVTSEQLYETLKD
jgi:hypothetical protein